MNRTSLPPIAVALLLSGSAAAQQIELNGRPLVQAARAMKPGQYIWEPERAPKGPALVVVNLQTQRLLFFRNGVPIAASTISSGKTGHETPTGVFTILQKNEKHFSKTYNNAPMPNMQRLTWKGIALHAGNLPGYPASHGCVRLPLAFSKLLFGQTALGMTVVITSHPGFPAQRTRARRGNRLHARSGIDRKRKVRLASGARQREIRTAPSRSWSARPIIRLW